MQKDPLLTSSYDYTLPENLIAKYPVSPRDSAKLLVYNRADESITHTYFYDLEKFIPKDYALLLNDTKVIKARLFGHKPSGGKIEILINRPLDAHKINVYARGKVKVDTLINFDSALSAKILKIHEDGSRDVEFYHEDARIRFEELLPIIDKIGHIPLPPYLQRDDENIDKSEYQSVFAEHEGAVAAPTASLHFTDEQFDKIKKKYAHAFLTLHVGAGTFKPVDAKIITDHPMHSEYFDISEHAQEILNSKVKVLSIGTTSTRTVEYWARTKEIHGEANLFLHPNNRPKRVDALLTNFHLPKSTLLMLVASFVGLETTQRIYKEAIEKEYRFFSYGDAMLIL